MVTRLQQLRFLVDDPSLTTHEAVDSTDEPTSLDAMTAELKAEFALLERAALTESEAVRRARAALDALDDLDPNPRPVRRMITCAVERAKLILDALDQMQAFASADFVTQHARYWAAVLAYCLWALAKLNSLLARSQRASLRVPLFADGPELSGYKHRLR